MMSISPNKNKQRRWFMADDIAIAIDTDPVDAVVADLQDSVLLQRHEPLLMVLAEILQNDYDWQPVSKEQLTSSQLTHSVCLANDNDVILAVCLPEERRDRMQLVGEQLKSEVLISVHHQPWSFHTTDTWLTPSELDELKNPGSVLLVPEGMDGDVMGEVRVGRNRCHASLSFKSFAVIIDSQASTQSITPSGSAHSSAPASAVAPNSSSDSVLCKITLHGAGCIDQRAPEEKALGLSSEGRARIEFEHRDFQNTQYLADVIRIGEGLGLRIVEP